MSEIKNKANAITSLLIEQAHTKLTSGVELTATELKVCLDIAKQYGIETQEEPKNVIENLPFDESGEEECLETTEQNI
tara:strand:+ start:4525 stop:4758 length:234 start_codon:yes stop_codon:yes gene_type:complete